MTDYQLILTEFNKVYVEESSASGEELEYVLVADTPENRKAIDLALATHFSWAITEMDNPYSLTAGGSEILTECSSDGFIDIAEILYQHVLSGTAEVWYSDLKGFYVKGCYHVNELL